jgi:hypothetical protein
MMPHDAGKELVSICHPDRAADYTQTDRRDKGMIARFFGLLSLYLLDVERPWFESLFSFSRRGYF